MLPEKWAQPLQNGTGALLDAAALGGQRGPIPGTSRKAPGGAVFHCINRGCRTPKTLSQAAGYAAFERVMAHALDAVPVPLLACCLMSNHAP